MRMRSPTPSPTSSAGRSSRNGSSSSRRSRRRAARRSCGARYARACSAGIPATCRRSRIPTRSTRSRVRSAELAGRVALVTGGGRGIGANIARELAAAGMRVAVSARSREQVDEVAREIGGTGIVADVSKEDDVQRVVEEVGAIDLLVANAGIDAHDEAAWEVKPSRWWHVFEVNVLGVYLSCRAVVPGMLERRRGRIVITASGAA